MAAPMKKKRVVGDQVREESENGSDMDEEDCMDEVQVADEEEDMEGQEVQIDFEARNPEDSDYHGIRKLLHQLFLKANINLSEMTDVVLSQNYVGSVIKQCPPDDEEDDDSDDAADDVFGVITVINLTDKKNMDFVKQLKSVLLDRCKQPEIRAKFSDAFNSEKSIGLLINERFINIPPQIALPSFNSLWKEIDRAKQKKMPYDFDCFLMISKTYLAPALPGQSAKKECIFTNCEEAFFHQDCSFSYNYSVAEERDTSIGGTWDEEDAQMEPLRTVMIIPADKMSPIMNRLGGALSQ